ncbi:hypothetical protein JR316_0013233 [Psilocybe cubensis]|uniref:Uncharacterized protein n=2 Tax=Psilocybe cubensis TaxID=181762 RepID=A0A8H8CHP3_PSICU|nr:hypothetical protein JR316_0013233 [Psilocybe cubensis]KAH9474768.1 hypothetical protein JR316_0013233 [Psilocybe cubensis]
MSASSTQVAQPKSCPPINFTVHEYVDSVCPRQSQQSVLKQGYDSILALYDKSIWKSVNLHAQQYEVKTSNSYVFNMAPPMSSVQNRSLKELKEWGSEVTDEEIFTLEALDEFRSSDFGQAGNSPTSTSTLEKKINQRATDTFSAELDGKDKQFKSGSLFRVIPQPHLYPTPSDSKIRTVNTAYTKCKPIYLPPYVPETYPKESRVAWVIPLRGSLRWENCTSGEVLDNVAVPSPAQLGSKNQISWTTDAIVKFWDYLLMLRQKGSLGRLGVSFQPSKKHKHTSQISKTSNPVLNSSKITATSISRQPCRGQCVVDYIKVFQDALDAPYVRRAIDVFRYQYTQENGTMQHIRLLKGSRLALVDELSQGILVL